MSMDLGEDGPTPAPQCIQNLLNDLGSEFSKKESRLQLVERQLNEITEALKIARHDLHREKSLRLEALSANVSLQREVRELHANNASLKIQTRELHTAVTTLKRQRTGGKSKCLSTPPSLSANASFEGATTVDEAGISRHQFARSESLTPLGHEYEAARQILSKARADAAEDDALLKDEQCRFWQERARAWEDKQRLKSAPRKSGTASFEGGSGIATELEEVSKTASGVEDGSSIRPLIVDENETRALSTPATEPSLRKANVRYVDPNSLCCYLCKRTFKTSVQLRNHANSDRHKQSLTDPRHLGRADARMAKRAKDATKAKQTQGPHEYVPIEAGARPSTSRRATGEFDRGGAETARSASVEIISSHADDPMDEDFEGSFSCDGSMHET